MLALVKVRTLIDILREEDPFAEVRLELAENHMALGRFGVMEAYHTPLTVAPLDAVRSDPESRAVILSITRPLAVLEPAAAENVQDPVELTPRRPVTRG